MQVAVRPALCTIPNLRDVGGTPLSAGMMVGYGRLWRSAALDRASRADLAAIERLGIRTVIDLRAPEEVLRRPDRLPPRVHFRNVPFNSEQLTRSRLKGLLHDHAGPERVADTMCDVYRDLATNHIPELAHVFDILTDESAYPVLIHCQGGKDRTGFVVALLLFALGADQETILSEYLLTNGLLRPRVDRTLSLVNLLTLGLVSSAMIRPIFMASREYLLSALRVIDYQFGSVDSYLASHLGVDSTMRERLARILRVAT